MEVIRRRSGSVSRVGVTRTAISRTLVGSGGIGVAAGAWTVRIYILSSARRDCKDMSAHLDEL